MRHLLLFLLVVQSLCAQENPIQWSAQAQQAEENTYDVILKASIQENWKLYDVNLPAGGPLPTLLIWNNATAIGALEGSTPKTGYDPIFEMELAYHLEELVWVQSVKTSDDNISITIEYQACDDAICIFRDETLIIPLSFNRHKYTIF